MNSLVDPTSEEIISLLFGEDSTSSQPQQFPQEEIESSHQTSSALQSPVKEILAHEELEIEIIDPTIPAIQTDHDYCQPKIIPPDETVDLKMTKIIELREFTKLEFDCPVEMFQEFEMSPPLRVSAGPLIQKRTVGTQSNDVFIYDPSHKLKTTPEYKRSQEMDLKYPSKKCKYIAKLNSSQKKIIVEAFLHNRCQSLAKNITNRRLAID